MQIIWNSGTRRFIIACSYEERAIPKAAGCRWDPTIKCWWTADPMVAARFRAQCAPSALVELEKASAVAECSVIADPSALPPELADQQSHLLALLAPNSPAPYPYQIAGSLLLLSATAQNPGVILGDDMGLGKTLQGLLVAAWKLRENPATRIIVCCPTAVGPSWVREAKKWVGITAHLHQGTKCKGLPERGVIIVPYSVVSSAEVTKAIMAHPVDVLICDEIHYLKNPKTLRTTAVWSVIAPAASHLIVMSGTPVPNRPREIAHIACRLTRAFGSEWTFLNRYCDPQKVWTGRKYVQTFDGCTNPEELAQKLRTSGVLIRRMKTEVLKELPKKRRDIVVLGDKGKAAKRLIESGIDVAEIRLLLDSPDAPDFSECSLMRHADALDRCEVTAEYITDALEESPEPAVVFTHHKDVAWSLHKLLGEKGVDAIVATGEMDAVCRQAAVDSFAAGNAKVFIGTLAACGTGLNGLQTRATRVYMAESSWTPGDNAQAEDRVCRIGAVARDGIQCVYLVSEGGVDSYVLDVVLGKEENINTIMGPANGITEAEQIIVPEAAPVAEKVARPAPPVSMEDRRTLHAAVRQLDACNADGATVENGVGYNKLDGAFGHKLACAPGLTDRQCHAAARLLTKYKNTQVPFAKATIERVCALTKSPVI